MGRSDFFIDLYEVIDSLKEFPLSLFFYTLGFAAIGEECHSYGILEIS